MAAEDTVQAQSDQSTQPTSAEAAPATLTAAPEKLDEIEEIDFLLEEIESKIAPLALA
ncbi:Xan family putative trans-acting RiPP leader peptide [Corallococcus sp. M34]|uniref:Xan family putative trans-acting RiPP leader peptide n=1 Tax=Citreicoccus inhibens TaxID=2849499 RepID=UPI0011C3F5E1|nr:Xan family putative trans-acting RiPP leader peptide [Citreicoccus inhibens]MBU8894125.1 Xan family putative trans-acting RiPP leader peptide [Citreicoccus inhibens]